MEPKKQDLIIKISPYLQTLINVILEISNQNTDQKQ